MKLRIVPSELGEREMRRASCALFLTSFFLPLGFSVPARSQEVAPAQSIAEAARNARDQQTNSTNHPKVITNDDFLAPAPSPSPSASPEEPASKNEAEAPAASSALAPTVTAEKAGCDNPEAERLAAELESVQGERDQIRSDLNYQAKVISDGDVDMTNFKPGSSGVAFASPPMSQAQPQAPARVTEVMLDEKIASLKDALRIACGSPEDAGAERNLDAAKQQLKLLQQEFNLDQSAYYSKTNYSEDSAGKDKLDAEQRQIESVQAEIDRLTSELAASKTNGIVE
jgi:hypothetical protein